MGGLILGEDLQISLCKAGEIPSHWISLDSLASQEPGVPVWVEEMTECKHVCDVGSCDTTYPRSYHSTIPERHRGVLVTAPLRCDATQSAPLMVAGCDGKQSEPASL